MKAIREYACKLGERTAESDAENVVKACDIGQGENTSGGSPQCVRGKGKLCRDGTFADPHPSHNNKKKIVMGSGGDGGGGTD
jgi:ribose 5-phosphate isomerase RpiB